MTARTSLVGAKFAFLEAVACDPALSALENRRPSVQRSLKNGAPGPGLEGQGNSTGLRHFSDISLSVRARRNPAVPAASLKEIQTKKTPPMDDGALRSFAGHWQPTPQAFPTTFLAQSKCLCNVHGLPTVRSFPEPKSELSPRALCPKGISERPTASRRAEGQRRHRTPEYP